VRRSSSFQRLGFDLPEQSADPEWEPQGERSGLFELGRDCRVRVAGGFETRDLERVLEVLAQGGCC